MAERTWWTDPAPGGRWHVSCWVKSRPGPLWRCDRDVEGRSFRAEGETQMAPELNDRSTGSVDGSLLYSDEFFGAFEQGDIETIADGAPSAIQWRSESVGCVLAREVGEMVAFSLRMSEADQHLARPRLNREPYRLEIDSPEPVVVDH